MKQINDFIIIQVTRYDDRYSRLTLAPADGSLLPVIMPGQFIQIAIDAPGVFLRRPISINDVDYDKNTIDVLIRNAGVATAAIMSRNESDILNIILPLGNGFGMNLPKDCKPLLIGGGVGVAPLLYLGRKLKESGYMPEFLLGARTKDDLLELDDFNAIGKVHISTEDGSIGECGLVTRHSILDSETGAIYCCGPAPMMKAVADIARKRDIYCEVSLENMMACGLGACLCCVENTVKGNVCVCTEGPVFNINMLNW